MRAEAIDKLAQLAQTAAEPKLQHPKEEPNHVYFLNGVRQVAAPAARGHTASDLTAVAAFALRSPDTLPDIEQFLPSVWYSRGLVTAVLDDATRRDGVRLPLTFSPQMQQLINEDKQAKERKQPEFIRWLRVYFSEALGESNFIDLVSTLRFQVSSDNTAGVAPGKVSLGRQLREDVSGASGQLPSSVTLEVPVYHGILEDIQAVVPCEFDQNAKEETLLLIPRAGAIERALRGAEQQLGEKLRELLGQGFERLYYGVA